MTGAPQAVRDRGLDGDSAVGVDAKARRIGRRLVALRRRIGIVGGRVDERPDAVASVERQSVLPERCAKEVRRS
jgi:hypothetical protein